MTDIQKIAVIGSGVMGGSIAAHIANAGFPVMLMDIVPKDATSKNILAEQAIEKLLEMDPAPFTHKNKAKLITPANMETDLDKLGEMDWIIEVVLERIDVKHDVYAKIEKHRKKGSIVSSNTSTLPLHELTKTMPESFKKDFMITHFFNPPRYMRLLELVTSQDTRKDAISTISAFVDKRLGKGMVPCNDTPGFIANRIGVYWLIVALQEAMHLGLTVEEADALMGRPIGVPKTGVFGLMDLIGIDLMPLIAKSFLDYLPSEDAFRKTYNEPDLIKKMIADGYTGRKGKGGFYRVNKDNGGKVKEAICLKSGEYRTAEKKPALDSVEAAKGGLRALVEHPDRGGQYAKSVLIKLLGYVASLVPEMSDDILAVDNAMKWGYNWKYGPFELIDRLGTPEQCGAKWLAEELKKSGQAIPGILSAVGDGTFYKDEPNARRVMNLLGGYRDILITKDMYFLADITRGKKPIAKNASARLWDIGDGIACLEYTSKMNSVDLYTLEMIEKSIEIVKGGYKGLVIANDAENFCVGANLGFALFAANTASWKMIEEMVEKGQQAYMHLKYAPFPVVTAVSGMALGGGCEVLLHSDAVQAHVETYTGLVEVGVGVIPGWGGCKEMLIRHMAKRKAAGGLAAVGRAFDWLSPVKMLNTMPAIRDVFMQVGLAKVAKSAEEAKDMLILNDKSRITMNRARLLPDAKELCLSLVNGYTPPEPQTLRLPGRTARAALYMGINDFVKSGKATPYDEVVSKALAEVLSGGKTDVTVTMTEQQIFDLEREAFMTLVKQRGTWDRIEHMLETGKPLRN
ncbi:MAG: 3-hydroxyacyl-CoA dehydrogenase [Rickettsiales bacterium]|jgi:3-hydroxyacyl-CoA dehydrogenase|nr:3-hydroxyacyl-CoA dehydrogenase [Rickettsiales bacterium]